MRYRTNKNSTYMAQIKLIPIIILITMLFATIKECSGQKTKTVEIINLKDVRIAAFVDYDESNAATDTSYYISGQNAKYSAIVDIITLAHGNHSDVLGLLKKCVESLSEGKGTSLKHNGSMIYITSDKALNLYGVRGDENGFVPLNKTQLSKMIDSMEAIGKK